jgi:diguanylate cyclase (GGDEF)-like protein
MFFIARRMCNRLYPERLRRFWHPTMLFGLILVVLGWTIAIVKVRNDAETTRNETISDLVNLSLLIEQDFLRTKADLDRIIRFLRRSYERSDFNVDWSTLVQEDFTANERTVQIAIIDAKGQMVTSTAMPRPKTLVDLSDREHFRVHKSGNKDELHISRPIIGRASGKWSIQFTRRFTQADGSFGGVIVVSLDPEQLLSTFGQLDVPDGAGYALIGHDDIIRAGTGRFAGLLGRGFMDSEGATELPIKDRNVRIVHETIGNQSRLVGLRGVTGTGMSVVVSLPSKAAPSSFIWHKLYLLSGAVSLVVLIAVSTSVARQRRHVRHITQLAHADSLTKLPNRLSFRKALADAAGDGRPTRPFTLHLIDLDRFKAVNDTHGHPVGDELLCAVAQRLSHSVRKGDTVFRLGGDEFALLQWDTLTTQHAEAAARRICRVIAEPFEISGHRLFIGASIGIAIPGDDLRDDTALLKGADLALYAAKGSGRGMHRVYGAELNVALLERQTLEADMRGAIESNQFEVHYQRKVMLDGSQRTIGFEALVRWRHPKRGMVSPADFIPIAEDTGFIIGLGAWIVREVCREFAHRGGTETVAVNFSATQFARGDVVETVSEALRVSGLHAHRFEVEITESMLMTNEQAIVGQLEQLRALGIRISLDDFGTGYSSLGYLERYPIDCIKIDRSFVAKLGGDKKAVAITRAIITLAKELNMKTVAEGVEEAAQADILRSLGCEIAQGYLFGRPMPAAQTWLERAA